MLDNPKQMKLKPVKKAKSKTGRKETSL